MAENLFILNNTPKPGCHVYKPLDRECAEIRNKSKSQVFVSQIE